MGDKTISELRQELKERLHKLRIENLKIERDFKDKPWFYRPRVERTFNTNSREIEALKKTLKDLEPIR